MKSKVFGWVVPVVVLALAASIAALAQDSDRDGSVIFKGAIDAYSPQTSTTGPYEVHGPWSLSLKRHSGKADFSAALNMELSDGWVLTKNNSNFDPTTRDRHTHHVTLVDATVTWLTNGFQIDGMATVTLNGNPAPVSPTPLEIVITGGTDVEFSNITLTFGSPGSNHFGTPPLTGVVRSVEKER